MRAENILTVLLASPSDVLDERTVVSQTIDEINLQRLPYRFELLTWEGQARAGIASLDFHGPLFA